MKHRQVNFQGFLKYRLPNSIDDSDAHNFLKKLILSIEEKKIKSPLGEKISLQEGRVDFYHENTIFLPMQEVFSIAHAVIEKTAKEKLKGKITISVIDENAFIFEGDSRRFWEEWFGKKKTPIWTPTIMQHECLLLSCERTIFCLGQGEASYPCVDFSFELHNNQQMDFKILSFISRKGGVARVFRQFREL